MNSENGQHETNDLLKQIPDVAQNTLDAQNMQLTVLQRFDKNMVYLNDRLGSLDNRVGNIEGEVKQLNSRVESIESRVEGIDNKLDQFIDISDRNFTQIGENFKIITDEFKSMNSKLDRLLDLEGRIRTDRNRGGQSSAEGGLIVYHTCYFPQFQCIIIFSSYDQCYGGQKGYTSHLSFHNYS